MKVHILRVIDVSSRSLEMFCGRRVHFSKAKMLLYTNSESLATKYPELACKNCMMSMAAGAMEGK